METISDITSEHVSNKETTSQEENLKCLISSLEIDLSLRSESNCIYSSRDFTFDNVIGHLEDMLVDKDFHTVQKNFLDKYWEEFEDSEENKHSYLSIFNEYTNIIEDFIVEYLEKRIENFDMIKFASELEERRDNLEGEVFEVLLTLTDFSAFKEIMLDHKAMKEGKLVDLTQSLYISSVPL